MFGMFRFFLALMVVLEHLFFIQGIHPGVIAVVCFYMLAGYVMSHSFLVTFKGSPRAILRFYKDRALRIYPLYWIVSALILGVVALTRSAEIHLTPANVFSILTLFPLDYWMYLPWVYSINHNSFPIPPSPSIALEMHFYLLLPFLLLVRNLKDVCQPLSLGVFFLAAQGTLHTYYYGYALLPGTLYLFISGMNIYKMHHGSRMEATRAKRTLYGTGFFLLGALLYFAKKNWLNRDHTFEIILGFYVGAVAISVLGQVRSKHVWEEYLGKISYALFLAHFLVIWVFNHWAASKTDLPSFQTLVVYKVLLVLLVTLGIYHVFDEPIQRFRKRLQRTAPAL